MGRKQIPRFRKPMAPNKMNPRRSTWRHIIKKLKVKDKENVKSSAWAHMCKRKTVSYGKPHRLSTDFSAETKD